MIEGTYLLQVDTPLGRKEGIAELVANGGQLEACVDAPIIGKQEATGTLDGNRFTASGEIKVLLKGKVHYSLEGEVDETGVLVAKLVTNKGDFTVLGARM